VTTIVCWRMTMLWRSVPCKVKGRPKIVLNTLRRWARAIYVRVSAARAHYTITDRAAPLEQGWTSAFTVTVTCARRRARGPCSGLLAVAVRRTRYVAIEWPRVPSSSAWPIVCGRWSDQQRARPGWPDGRCATQWPVTVRRAAVLRYLPAGGGPDDTTRFAFWHQSKICFCSAFGN